MKFSPSTVSVFDTGKPYDVIAADTERDNYMSADEAKEYGIIDAVIKNRVGE